MEESKAPLQRYFHTVQKMKTQPFHLICKPAGARCNLDCQYCFYLPKNRFFNRGEHPSRMSDETLKLFIRQYILRQPPQCKSIHFVWQGGEPTLMGLDFFKKAVNYQKQFAKPQVEITNSFQTNGILIDDEWAQFFYENQFLVGISIDGPQFLHDCYRIFPNGKGTFSAVMKAIEKLHRYHVAFNTLTCVHSENSKYPIETYQFLKQIPSHYMQFIPIVEPQIGSNAFRGVNPNQKIEKATPRSVKPKQWGQFLLNIFEEWLKNDIGDFFVQFFDNILALVCGIPASICSFQPVCGRALVIEHNGDLYSCDHFVFPENRLGNLHEKDLSLFVNSEKQLLFGINKHRKMAQQCQHCKWVNLCFCECPSNRIVEQPTGFSQNYLCEGYALFFSATFTRFEAMAKALKAGETAENYQKYL